jgi:hypothetical protein
MRSLVDDQHAMANVSSSSCVTSLQQEPQAARAVQQQTLGCSQQQLLKLELLQILVAMRTANQSSSVRALFSCAGAHRMLALAMSTLALQLQRTVYAAQQLPPATSSHQHAHLYIR